MRRRATLRYTLGVKEEQALMELARKQFAIAEQLAHWCGVTKQAMSQVMRALNEAGLTETGADTKPQIWQLTLAGAARMQVPMASGRRHSSWAVMQNAVHRNVVEILLSKDHPGFHFLTRRQLYKKGLNPSHGEYAGVNEKGATWLVLVDDFMMESRVIEKHWNREHRPPRRYWPDVGRRWSSTVNMFMVATTSQEQLKRHEGFLQNSNVPADILYLKPSWRGQQA